MRKTTYTLHTTTRAPPTGLGKELAGTVAPGGVWMPDSVPWSREDAVLPCVQKLLRPQVAAEVELRRSAKLSALRVHFRELCHQHGISSPPMNAFERWRFLCKWEETSALLSDPLLPTGPCVPLTTDPGSRPPSSADEWLAADLGRAGMCEAARGIFVRALKEEAQQAASAVTKFMAVEAFNSSAGLRVRLIKGEGPLLQLATYRADSAKEGTGRAANSVVEGVTIATAYVEKLRALHRRHGTQEQDRCQSGAEEKGGKKREERRFRLRLLALLLRYHSIGGVGFQAALGGALASKLLG